MVLLDVVFAVNVSMVVPFFCIVNVPSPITVLSGNAPTSLAVKVILADNALLLTVVAWFTNLPSASDFV